MKLIALLLWISGNSFAQDMMTGLTPPNQQKTILSYSGRFYDKTNGPESNLSSSYQTLDFSAPVYRTDTYSVTWTVSGSQLSVDPSQSNISNLYDLKTGFAYTRALDEKRLWSVSARYGSASDKPFASNDVSTLGLTAFYSYPDDQESNRWLLLVDYSNNRPILNNIPLPGFAYFYNPSKEFRAVLGAPFAMVNWQYSDKWSLEGFTLVPWIFKGSLNYSLNAFSKIYTGFDFSQVTFYLEGRQNKKERLFYDEKKLFVGLKLPLAKFLFTEFEAGHAFDRRFFSHENYATDPDDAVSVGNAFYGKLTLRFIL